MLSRRIFIFSYVSFICTECATGSEASSFPLCSKTPFKLRFEESINSLHSVGSYFFPIWLTRPSMLLQKTSESFIEKNSRNSFSRCLYHENVVPGARNFSCAVSNQEVQLTLLVDLGL